MTADHDKPEHNDNNNPAEAVTPPLPTPGEMLRTAREQKNWTQRDIAERLRLRLQIIELLEDDDYDSFASATFIRGYLRSYSRILELDEETVFKAYQQLGYNEPTTINMQSFSRRRAREENDSRLMMITYIVILAVLGLAILWWVQQPDFSLDNLTGSNDSAATEQLEATTPELDEAASLAAQRAAQNTDTSVEPADEQPLLESDVSASDMSTSGSSNDPQQDAGQTQQPPALQAGDDSTVSGAAEADDNAVAATVDNNATETPPAAANDNQQQSSATTEANESAANLSANAPTPTSAAPSDADLVLTFEGECWVKIEDASGETIAIGVKPAGYVMPLNGNAPYNITLGAPEVVAIQYQGEDFDMSQFRSGRVARFNVPQQ